MIKRSRSAQLRARKHYIEEIQCNLPEHPLRHCISNACLYDNMHSPISAASPTDISKSTYRFRYLGQQNLNRQSSTGFGAVQKPLKEIYFNHILSAPEFDKSHERTMFLTNTGLTIRFWEPRSRQFQQQSYPYEHISYVELVNFHTVKGKKRYFGYFKRHTERNNDVVPDSVLIPLHKKDHRVMHRIKHLPVLVLIMRRPSGIPFLDCHVFAVEPDESVGISFIEEFDLLSKDFCSHKKGNLFFYTPYDREANMAGERKRQQIQKWSSQPMLQGKQLSISSDVSTDSASTSQHSVASPQQTKQLNKLHKSQIDLYQNHSKSPLLSSRSTPIPLTEKYKELKAYNIPEYEYFTHQEIDVVHRQYHNNVPVSPTIKDPTGAVTVQVQKPQVNPLPLPPRKSKGKNAELYNINQSKPAVTTTKATSPSTSSNVKHHIIRHPPQKTKESSPTTSTPTSNHAEQNSHDRPNVHYLVSQIESCQSTTSIYDNHEEKRPKPVATVYPRLLPGSVAVLPQSVSQEDILKITSKNPRSPISSQINLANQQQTDIQRHKSQVQRGVKQAEMAKLAEIRKDLTDINFTNSTPDFSVALGYLP